MDYYEILRNHMLVDVIDIDKQNVRSKTKKRKSGIRHDPVFVEVLLLNLFVCVIFCILLLFLLTFGIGLSVLPRFTSSDYSFGGFCGLRVTQSTYSV